ncbi:MAG: hypothetical protein Q7S33_01705, partial [Nanoarchaeota archaeon]|nr:hypothetical protein [Nanoarchaeota archaeon]
VENVFVTNQKNKLFNKEYILAVADEKTYKFEDIESIVNFIDLSRNYPNTINSEDYRNLYSKILNLDKTKFNINGNPYFLLVSDILVLAQKENLKKSESRSYDAENILKLFWLKSNDHSISQYTGSRLYKTAPYFINLYQNEINQNKYNFWASLVLKKLSSLDILISVDKRFDRDDFLKTINYGSSSDIEDFLKYYSEVSPQVTNEIMLLIPEFSNIYNNEKLINENTNTKTSISLAVYRFRTENPSWSIEKSIDYILQKRKEFGNKEIIGSNTYFISFVHQEEMFSNNPLKVYAIDRGAFVDSSGGEDGLKGPKEKELIKNTIINSKDKGETTIWINVHGAPTRLALDQTTYFSPGEIGDILLKRGNLQEVILILDACHSYNFAENLINYLEIKGSKSYPTIITETNKNRFGRFNVLLKSFISLNKKLDEPLLGKDVLNAGSFSFDIQDSAFFFSQTGKDKPIEISQNYMNHECTGEDCVNGVCTASAYVNNLEEDSCLDNPDFSKGVAKVASDEKMCKDPVLYRMDYFVPIFHKRLENDKTEIKKWSEFTGVPQEAILSGILVEDIRMDNEGIEEKVHNLKSYVRSLVPNKILETFGHNPNPEDQKSVYGFIHCDTFRASLLYLISLKDLNQELKKSLLEIENNHNQYVKENGGYGVECMSENYNQKVISSVGRVAITQKAQIEYWKRAGYDIFNYKFKTINTLGERAGVLITLTSIYSPEYEYPKGITKNSGGGGLLEGAVYKNRFIKCDNKGENCVVETSSDSPRLGGTILWKGRDVSYGELAKIYVDNGYVNSYLQK